ncbi:hypothetical protein FHG87_004528 [Trinorchestia longiramus]|nr:hypothetical protein FHG87_004528 [Trinorchestia longiramus]
MKRPSSELRAPDTVDSEDSEVKVRVKRGLFNLGPRLRIAEFIKKERKMTKEEHYFQLWQVGRHDRRGNRAGYRLMTTVAVPVFDLNLTSNITKKVLERHSVWVSRTEEVSLTSFTCITPHATLLSPYTSQRYTKQ